MQIVKRQIFSSVFSGVIRPMRAKKKEKNIFYTPRASSEQYTLSPAQQILRLFRNTALSEFDAPVPLRDIAQFSSPCDPLRSFELAAGMIHYASTPKTRHFCSFRRASIDSWFYTNDNTAFLIDSAQLEQTVPYVLFYISTPTTN